MANQDQNRQQQQVPQGSDANGQQGQQPKREFFLLRGFKAVKSWVGKGVDAVKETVHDHPVVSGIFMGLGIGAGSYVTYKVMAPMIQAPVVPNEEPKLEEAEDNTDDDTYENDEPEVEYVDTDR